MTPHRAALDAAVTEVRGEINRVDTKAACVASLVTFLLSAGTAALVTVPMRSPARVAGWVGVLLLVGSMVAVVLALRPRLGRGRGSWLLHAETSPADLVVHFAQPSPLVVDQAAQLKTLSVIGGAKFRLLRAATDLLLAALAVAVATGGLALLG